MKTLEGVAYTLADALRIRDEKLWLALNGVPEPLSGVLGGLFTTMPVENSHVRLLPQLGYFTEFFVGRQLDGQVVFHMLSAARVGLRGNANGYSLIRHFLDPEFVVALCLFNKKDFFLVLRKSFPGKAVGQVKLAFRRAIKKLLLIERKRPLVDAEVVDVASRATDKTNYKLAQT